MLGKDEYAKKRIVSGLGWREQNAQRTQVGIRRCACVCATVCCVTPWHLTPYSSVLARGGKVVYMHYTGWFGLRGYCWSFWVDACMDRGTRPFGRRVHIHNACVLPPVESVLLLLLTFLIRPFSPSSYPASDIYLSSERFSIRLTVSFYQGIIFSIQGSVSVPSKAHRSFTRDLFTASSLAALFES